MSPLSSSKLLLFLIIFPFSGFCQEQFGSSFSNYTPTNSVHLNPTSMLDAKVRFDFHIIGVGTYTMNNLVYVENNSLMKIIRNKRPVDENSLKYNQGKNFYHVYNRNFVSVLSGVWSQGDHAIGLSFNVKSFTAVRRIPKFVGPFIENGVTQYTPQHDIDYSIKNLRVGSVHYGEIKLSYAHTFLKKRRNMFMAGISINKLMSIAGAGLNAYDINLDVRDKDLLAIFSFSGDMMMTPNPRLNTKGGIGLDLGFTFQKMKSDAVSYLPNSPKGGCRKAYYKYWIAASVLDIGSLKLDPGATKIAGYEFQNYNWFNYDSITATQANATEIFQAQDPNLEDLKVKKPYRVRLATALSVQGDYNFWNNKLYFNASVMQGIPVSINKFGIRRANSLMVGPRYETKYFDLSMPLSLYEYRYAQLGLSMRIWLLTIGTDKLFSWIGNGDLRGMDFYFQIKVPIYSHKKCRASNKKGLGGQPRFRQRVKGCDAYSLL